MYSCTEKSRSIEEKTNEATENVEQNISSIADYGSMTCQFHANQSDSILQYKSLHPLGNNHQNKKPNQLGAFLDDYFERQRTPIQRKENKTGLPDRLKTGVENLSGYSMDDVRVRYNSSKPAQIGALAYTQGTNIHVAPGQKKHLSHEAWHVVQQKQGRVRPTIQARVGAINDDVPLEHEADVMGSKALHMTNGYQAAKELTLEKKRQVNPMQTPIQRYVTKSTGLSVAGELHTKSNKHRRIEANFARYVKGVYYPTLCYWQESETPGTGSVYEEPASSENPDHFLVWDIDRMRHHYKLIRSVLAELPEPIEQPATLDGVQVAQIALSVQSMLETLNFLKGDLRYRSEDFAGVSKACKDMSVEYIDIFNRLDEGAKGASLDATLRQDFAEAKFPELMTTIDQQISKLIPSSGEMRQISYDFTRTVAMNNLANKKKGVRGVWVIGEYHVQEIEEHLSGDVNYDLVSMNDFNADVKDYDESLGGSTIKVDYLGELLTLSRKLSANLHYFLNERDKVESMEARLAHWGRCMDVLFALEDLVQVGLKSAKISEALLPGKVKLQDLLQLVRTIYMGLNNERETTLSYDLEDPDVSLPEDLYLLMRDKSVLKAARDLNVLTGLAEFPLIRELPDFDSEF